jgi:RNA polymerase sigma-70 factor (ECF subfamily)
MSTNTDGQLVSLCRTGDLAAFEELVGRHRRSIVLYACRRLGCFDDGEDIAQEAFVRAYFLMPQLREPDRFVPWLRAIADRLCLMSLRSRREECVEPAELERLSPTIEPSEPDADVLGSLPDSMRRAVSLTYFDGYTCAETAEILGTRPPTLLGVSSRSRAKNDGLG